MAHLTKPGLEEKTAILALIKFTKMFFEFISFLRSDYLQQKID
jgi:hypothetical protein